MDWFLYDNGLRLERVNGQNPLSVMKDFCRCSFSSTVQAELSKLNFNFDDIRTYFLQVLRDCCQISFVTLIKFCLLSKKKKPTPFLTDNIKIHRTLTKISYIVFQVLKVFPIKIC